MIDRAVSLKDIPGYPDQLWQEGGDCLAAEASQLSNKLIEELCSLGILLRNGQLSQFLESLEHSLSLLWW